MDIYYPFYVESVVLIRKFSKLFKSVSMAYMLIDKCNSMEINELDLLFERKLAYYITLDIENGTHIDKNIVINKINTIVDFIINELYRSLPEPNITDNYIISLLKSMFNLSDYHAHIIGQTVKHFVKMDIPTDKIKNPKLYNIIEGTYSLYDETKSPLSKLEIEAFKRYLCTKKTIYVNALLNLSYEFSQSTRIIATENTMTQVLESGWLFVFSSILQDCIFLKC